ncbi:MAG: HTH domain-containing protein [Alkalibacterium sp.]|nr:HTH domain-containing protein [Alkalibacterium sp.]
MLNQKDISILELFNQNKDTYIKSKMIADYLGVTDKTARKYIKQLNQELDNKVAQIDSISGHGFTFVVHDDKACKKLFQTSKNALHEKSEIGHIEESKDCQYFILRQFFFGDEQLFLEDLMTDLAVSQSTLLNDIYDINKKFNPMIYFSRQVNEMGCL